MTREAPLFVAEINEHGDIAWVWVQDDPKRAARPIRRVSRHLAAAGRAGSEFVGAPRDAIVGWMRSAAGDQGLV